MTQQNKMPSTDSDDEGHTFVEEIISALQYENKSVRDLITRGIRDILQELLQEFMAVKNRQYSNNNEGNTSHRGQLHTYETKLTFIKHFDETSRRNII